MNERLGCGGQSLFLKVPCGRKFSHVKLNEKLRCDKKADSYLKKSVLTLVSVQLMAIGVETPV